MLDHDCRLSTDVSLGVFSCVVVFSKGLGPSVLSERTLVLVKDIGGNYRVDQQLTETAKLRDIREYTASKRFKAVAHENMPGQVHRILFRDTLVLIHGSQGRVLLDEQKVRNATMVNVWRKQKERC